MFTALLSVIVFGVVVVVVVSGIAVREPSAASNETAPECLRGTSYDVDAGACVQDSGIADVVDNATSSGIVVRKCCPRGLMFDSHVRACVNASEDVVVDMVHELAMRGVAVHSRDADAFVCNDTVVDIPVDDAGDLRISDDGDLLLADATTVPPGVFCVDADVRGGLAVRYCGRRDEYCGRHLCVNKCCPEGYSYVAKRCVASRRAFRPVFHSVFRVVESPVRYAVTRGLACKEGRFTLRPDLHAQDKYYLQDGGGGGGLFVPLYARVFDVDAYCVEHVHWPSRAMDGPYVFLCFDDVNVGRGRDLSYTLLASGVITSCVFLLATLLVYLCLPSLQNLHGKTLMCNVASLLGAFACLAILQLAPPDIDTRVCKAVGFSMVFLTTAAFTWLGVMCFDIWWTFGSVRNPRHSFRHEQDRRRFLLYSTYAWGVATTLTVWTVLMNELGLDVPEALQPSIGDGSCYPMRGTAARLVYFVGPVALQVCCNLCLYLLTARHCASVRADIRRLQASDGGGGGRRRRRYMADKDRLVMNVKLFLVMGVAWAAELASNLVLRPAWLWYAADVVNVLQGVFIFLVFVLKRSVLVSLARRLGLAWGAAVPGAASIDSVRRDRMHQLGSSSTLCTITDSRMSPANSHRVLVK